MLTYISTCYYQLKLLYYLQNVGKTIKFLLLASNRMQSRSDVFLFSQFFREVFYRGGELRRKDIVRVVIVFVVLLGENT